MSRILQVAFTYFPDPSGGTEVYVDGLARGLIRRGHDAVVAAPAGASAAYEWDGVPVWRFGVDRPQGLEHAYGSPDEPAARNFTQLMAELRPQIVHLHGRTAAISERTVELAHAAGARVVFTYHTPTATCMRGDMLLDGRRPCDGRLERRRCVHCALQGLGVFEPVASALARMPRLAGRVLSHTSLPRPFAGLRVPALIGDNVDRIQRFLAKVDHIVAVCAWGRDVLANNGVCGEKLSLSRHGTSLPRVLRGDDRATRPRSDASQPLRLAYFGRIERAKGVDLLIAALQELAGAAITLDVYAIVGDRRSRDETALLVEAGRDHRVRLRDAVPSAHVVETMRDYDLITVPSRGLETGPLVVLEAFAAGVPVMGANRGGIAELVRDRIDGLLFEPDDPSAIADLLRRILVDRTTLDRLRDNVRSPRSDEAVVDDMARLYERLLGADRKRAKAAGAC